MSDFTYKTDIELKIYHQRADEDPKMDNDDGNIFYWQIYNVCVPYDLSTRTAEITYSTVARAAIQMLALNDGWLLDWEKCIVADVTRNDEGSNHVTITVLA